MIRVFTAFSGYDSQCMALERAGIEYDLVGWSEIDKYAILAHDAVFPQFKGRNYGDITKIDWNSVQDFDLFTYSSPCQDFSKAGRMRGGQENSGTRSSLLWMCREAIRIRRPKYCILENVENLVSEKFYPLFSRWEQTLASMGYNNYWKVVNAVECGVPQNRRRVFLVSMLDNDKYFEFPQPEFILTPNILQFLDDDDRIDARYYVDRKDIPIIEEQDGVLKVRQATGEGSIPVRLGGVFDMSFPTSKTRRGRVQGYGMICPTLNASSSKSIIRYVGRDRFRRLTERECFRLQGLDEREIDLIADAGIPAGQQYKMAGNSICVDALVGIFHNLINGCEKPQDKLF